MNNAAAISAGINVLSRALPARVLLVDDDEIELELMSDRLSGAGFEVVRASNAVDALLCFERQWFPVVLTDLQMPGMDGLKLTEKLRSRVFDDTYIIMFSGRDDGASYERGYFAGVDDYLTKRVPDVELLARIEAGFSTLTLRRSLKQARAAIESASPIDPQSGAHSTRHLLSTLHSEIQRARRYQRGLSLVVVRVDCQVAGAVATGLEHLEVAVMRDLVHTVQNIVRQHIDWVARIACGLVVVLPETNLAAAHVVAGRIRGAVQRLESAAVGFALGEECLDLQANPQGMDPLDFLRKAEKNCGGNSSASSGMMRS